MDVSQGYQVTPVNAREPVVTPLLLEERYGHANKVVATLTKMEPDVVPGRLDPRHVLSGQDLRQRSDLDEDRLQRPGILRFVGRAIDHSRARC